MPNQVLITGATGYLGKSIARKYLQSSEDQIVLLLRAKNQTEFQNKTSALNQQLNAPDGRVLFYPLDLNQSMPFEQIATRNIRTIIHTAAITRFDVSQEDAQQVNVDGTVRLLEFAETCPNLEQVGLLSTIYSSGLKSGLMTEEFLDDNLGFANYYEWSKWELERYTLQSFAHLPCLIFRSATVIADCNDGSVTQYNVFHNTVRLLYQGLLTLLPGNTEVPIYLVTGEFVTNAIFSILQAAVSPQQQIFNVCHSKGQSIGLGEIIDTAFGVFSQDEQFVKRRVGKPRYINLDTFDIMMKQIGSFGSQSTRLATATIQP
ncbi:MAG: SDR family oxidoreductase, partial [Microcystis sp.]